MVRYVDKFYVGEVYSGVERLKLPVTPCNKLLFPVLSNIAACYEQFWIHGISLEYRPSVGSFSQIHTVPNISFTYFSNVNDLLNANVLTKSVLYNHGTTVVSSSDKPVVYKLPLSPDRKVYFCKEILEEGALDNNTYAVGGVVVFIEEDDGSVGDFVGDIYVNVDVSFKVLSTSRVKAAFNENDDVVIGSLQLRRDLFVEGTSTLTGRVHCLDTLRIEGTTYLDGPTECVGTVKCLKLTTSTLSATSTISTTAGMKAKSALIEGDLQCVGCNASECTAEYFQAEGSSANPSIRLVSKAGQDLIYAPNFTSFSNPWFRVSSLGDVSCASFHSVAVSADELKGIHVVAEGSAHKPNLLLNSVGSQALIIAPDPANSGVPLFRVSETGHVYTGFLFAGNADVGQLRCDGHATGASIELKHLGVSHFLNCKTSDGTVIVSIDNVGKVTAPDIKSTGQVQCASLVATTGTVTDLTVPGLLHARPVCVGYLCNATCLKGAWKVLPFPESPKIYSSAAYTSINGVGKGVRMSGGTVTNFTGKEVLVRYMLDINISAIAAPAVSELLSVNCKDPRGEYELTGEVRVVPGEDLHFSGFVYMLAGEQFSFLAYVLNAVSVDVTCRLQLDIALS